MLKHRLLMSALLIPATVGLFVWDHHLGGRAPVLFVVVMLVAARCVWELASLARLAGFQPNVVVMTVGAWLMILSSWWPVIQWGWPGTSQFYHFWQHLLLAAGVVIIGSILNAIFRFSRLEIRRSNMPNSPQLGLHIATLGVEWLGVGYIGVLLAYSCQLRWTTYQGNGYLNVGYFALSAMIVAAKMGDVGAYTFGRLIGGPKMTPVLSPGKTISGGIGHLLTAGFAAVVWLVWLGPYIGMYWVAWRVGAAFIFGVVVGFAGLIGDLAESLIKRDVGVKDAPALLPGFGGLLDLMDSILLAGPVAYAMWHLLR